MATVVMQFPKFAERAQRARAATDEPGIAWRDDRFPRLFPARARVEPPDRQPASVDPDSTGPEAA